MEQGDEISAVVDDEIGNTGKRLDQMLAVFRFGHAVAREHLKALCGKCRRNVVLRGEGIAARNVDLGAACAQNLGKVCRFCLEVDRHGDLLSLKGQGSFKFLLDMIENGHVGLYPSDLVRAGGGEGNVLDLTHGGEFGPFVVSF